MTDESGAPPEETYEDLMLATYRALCEHGYADLTLRKIAAESAKSRALIHYHYDSKDHLLVALLGYLIDSFTARIDDLSGAPPDQRLETLLDWVAFGPETGELSGQEYHAALFELRAQAPYNEAIQSQLQWNYLSIQDTCSDIIRDGIEQGVFCDVDPDGFAALALHSIDSARDADTMHGTEDTLETVLESLDRYVFSQLYADRPDTADGPTEED